MTQSTRIGQKNKITRRWAKRGSRASAPSDQRTASTYIFGAICPKEGKAVRLILPWCNTAMMDLHLRRSPPMSLPAVMQRCCWTRLDGISPPSSPYPTTSRSYRCRRNPPLSNRVFDNADALLDHCCDAWNKLEAQPWTIMSIGLRNWAHGS